MNELEEQIRALVADETRTRGALKDQRLREVLESGLVEYYPVPYFQRRYRSLVAVLQRRHEDRMLHRNRDTVEAFVALGGGKDKTGSVRSDLLRKYVKDFGLTIDIDGMIAEVDTDDSGLIEFEEFEDMLTPDDDMSPAVSPAMSPVGAGTAAARSAQRQQRIAAAQAAEAAVPKLREDIVNPADLPDFLTFRTAAPRLRRSLPPSTRLPRSDAQHDGGAKPSSTVRGAVRTSAAVKGRYGDGLVPTSAKIGRTTFLVDSCLKFPPPWAGGTKKSAALKEISARERERARGRGNKKKRVRRRHESLASMTESPTVSATLSPDLASGVRPAAVRLPSQLEDTHTAARAVPRWNGPLGNTVEVRLLPPPAVPACVPSTPTWTVDYQRSIQRPFTADAAVARDAAPQAGSAQTRGSIRALKREAHQQHKRLSGIPARDRDCEYTAYCPPTKAVLDRGVPNGWQHTDMKRWHHIDALRVGGS